MGYVKGKSAKSLGGGLSSAVLLGLCARSMVGASATPSVRVAFAGAGGLSLVPLLRALKMSCSLAYYFLAPASVCSLSVSGWVLPGSLCEDQDCVPEWHRSRHHARVLCRLRRHRAVKDRAQQRSSFKWHDNVRDSDACKAWMDARRYVPHKSGQ